MKQGLSIIVIHYRTPDILRECLRRLELYAPNSDIIVVDTDLQAETSTMLRQHYPRVTLLPTANYSMAHAVNVGLKAAKTNILVHMNADVFVQETTLQNLLEPLRQANIAMTGPVCINKDGKRQHQGVLYERYYQRLKNENSIPVNWLSGCIQMLKREAIDKVGGMNSNLRFYNEDLEWCWRLRKAGMHCHLVNTQVTHLGGSATPSHPSFLIEGYRGGYLFSRQHQTRLFQRLHRQAVLAEAGIKRRVGKKSQRQGYTRIYQMFKQQHFEDSPFGTQLSEANPDFLN